MNPKAERARTIHLRTIESLKAFNRHAKAMLDDYRGDKGPLMTMAITEAGNVRRLAQNSLMWLWWTAIGDRRGQTPNDVHAEYKLSLIPPIYASHPRYREKLELWLAIEAELKDNYELLLKVADKILSTADLTVKDFSTMLQRAEYMTTDIALPKPDDIYQDAMGRLKEEQDK